MSKTVMYVGAALVGLWIWRSRSPRVSDSSVPRDVVAAWEDQYPPPEVQR